MKYVAGLLTWMESPDCFWPLRYLQNMTECEKNSSQRNIWSQLMLNVPPVLSVVPSAIIIKRLCLCCGTAIVCVCSVLCCPPRYTCCVSSGSTGQLRPAVVEEFGSAIVPFYHFGVHKKAPKERFLPCMGYHGMYYFETFVDVLFSSCF